MKERIPLLESCFFLKKKNKKNQPTLNQALASRKQTLGHKDASARARTRKDWT